MQAIVQDDQPELFHGPQGLVVPVGENLLLVLTGVVEINFRGDGTSTHTTRGDTFEVRLSFQRFLGPWLIAAAEIGEPPPKNRIFVPDHGVAFSTPSNILNDATSVFGVEETRFLPNIAFQSDVTISNDSAEIMRLAYQVMIYGEIKEIDGRP